MGEKIRIGQIELKRMRLLHIAPPEVSAYFFYAITMTHFRVRETFMKHYSPHMCTKGTTHVWLIKRLIMKSLNGLSFAHFFHVCYCQALFPHFDLLVVDSGLIFVFVFA